MMVDREAGFPVRDHAVHGAISQRECLDAAFPELDLSEPGLVGQPACLVELIVTVRLLRNIQ
ncbi:hypothetical protein ASG91_05115 [Phycicoccus sp. Soil802]|nr:hypothetical protein ASG91_05115 [Phycicoccus sp. Soil802]